MKVAIIEDKFFNQKLLDITKERGWTMDFFENSTEFGYADLDSYDIIIADDDIPSIKGRELIHSISDKTHAQIFLMSNDSFSEEDLENSHINGLINKGDFNSIIDHLKYIDSKIRINRLIEIENKKILGFIQNGHTFRTENEIGILEINEFPSQYSLDRITREIKDAGILKLIVNFSGLEIHSPHLGIVVFLYKFMKDLKGKTAFWGPVHVSDQMRLCNLDSLIGLFSSLEEAMVSI